MSQRHLARTITLQSLAEWDFNRSILKKNINLLKINSRYLENFTHFDLKEKKFIKDLLVGIYKNIEKIDNYIKKYAPQWPIQQTTIVDRNILRIGVFELIFSKKTPPKVSINEAIEIAKSFGGETSSKFINGVLGAIYEDIKKNEKQTKKRK